MHRGPLRPKIYPFCTVWNVYSSCLASVTHMRTGIRETCHRRCSVCVCGTTHILSDADQSWGQPVSTVSWMSEVRYVAVCPANDWCTRHASLNSTLHRIGSQCSFCRTGVICSQCRVPVTKRAAAFCTDCVQFWWHSVQKPQSLCC